VIDPPKTRLVAMCKILRQDGMGVYLEWVTGTSIGPSLGDWDGRLEERRADRKTEVAWESKSKQARLFLTVWDNDNYWYPIGDLEWNLMHDALTVVVLGVTIQPDK